MNVTLLRGDITTLSVDVIVNAAKSSLRGGTGVDGAIHMSGGPEIMKECEEIGFCAEGNVVKTTAGMLDAKYVFHTVGPYWNGGNNNEEQLLGSCYANCLKLAEEESMKSIAFPNISTGVFGYPKPMAAEVALKEISKFHSSIIEKVIFVCYDEENFRIYDHLLNN